MPENPVSVSCLTTKFDYADFKSAAAKAETRKSEKMIFKTGGALLILSALILHVFVDRSVYNDIVYGLMAAAGAVVGCFYDIIAQYTVRRRAFRFFDANRERFIAQTTEFFEDKITFKTERYSAAVPYELLYKAYEDRRVFIIYTGINEMRFIPKRAMSNNDCTRVRNILHTKLQEKYQQEGAR